MWTPYSFKWETILQNSYLFRATKETLDVGFTHREIRNIILNGPPTAPVIKGLFLKEYFVYKLPVFKMAHNYIILLV